MEKLFVYVEGRAQGEPGEAAIGVAVTDKRGNVVEEVAQLIGRTTPQIAQYRALMEGCKLVREYTPQLVVFFTNDQALTNHVNGVFESREPQLKHLIEITKSLLNEFPQWKVNFLDRTAQSHAARLVERAFYEKQQTQRAHERLESRLLAETVSLNETQMEHLIEHVKRLKEMD
jgi:ribonuclease HI